MNKKVCLAIIISLTTAHLWAEILLEDIESLQPHVLAKALMNANKNFPDSRARKVALKKTISYYKDLVARTETMVKDLKRNIILEEFNEALKKDQKELNDKRQELIEYLKMIIILYREQLNYLNTYEPDHIEIQRATINLAGSEVQLKRYESEAGYTLQAQLAVAATIATVVGAGAYIYRKFFRTKKQNSIPAPNKPSAIK